MEVLRALYVCASGLRFSGRSRQKYTPHTTASLLEPELPRTRGESNPRPRDCESRRTNHETTSKGHFTRNKIARRHSESASTTARARRPARSPQRVHPRTAKTPKKKTRVFAPRPRPSPHSFARAPQESQTPRETRGRLARKHFSPSALPAAETPFYIDAASASARGDAQCVCSHERSISSSYERKHGSACASCIVPGCCAQVALCKLLHASGSTSVFKLFCARCASFSPQDARRLYLCAKCSA